MSSSNQPAAYWMPTPVPFRLWADLDRGGRTAVGRPSIVGSIRAYPSATTACAGSNPAATNTGLARLSVCATLGGGRWGMVGAWKSRRDPARCDGAARPGSARGPGGANRAGRHDGPEEEISAPGSVPTAHSDVRLVPQRVHHQRAADSGTSDEHPRVSGRVRPSTALRLDPRTSHASVARTGVPDRPSAAPTCANGREHRPGRAVPA